MRVREMTRVIHRKSQTPYLSRAVLMNRPSRIIYCLDFLKRRSGTLDCLVEQI